MFEHQEGLGAETWVYSHSAAYTGGGSVHLSSTPPIMERGASIREDLPGDNDEIPFSRRAGEAGREEGW